jgi:hypothetical protein
MLRGSASLRLGLYQWLDLSASHGARGRAGAGLAANFSEDFMELNLARAHHGANYAGVLF